MGIFLDIFDVKSIIITIKVIYKMLNTKNQKIGSDYLFEGLFTILVLLVTVVSAHLVFGAGTVMAADYTFSVSTSGPQLIDVSGGGDGTAISEDEIRVMTTCRDGYNLALSTSVSNNNLYLNGLAENNASNTYFVPSDGVTTLAAADNTWGFYLPTENGVVPNSNSVFAAVPTLENAVNLKTPSDTASASDIDDTFSLYYGVSVSSDMTPGTYKMIKDNNDTNGALVYYATLAEDCFKYTVVFNPTGTNLGTAVTGTGTVANQTLMEGLAENLTTSVYAGPTVGDVTYVFDGWNTEQDGSGTHYDSGESVTDLTTGGNVITLYAQWKEACQAGGICYAANGDDVVGTMGVQAIESNTLIMLLASNYSRVGYGFAGWSEDQNAIQHPTTAKIYGPQETISFEAGAYDAVGLDLYAVWVPSAGSLQDSSKVADLCGTGTDSLTTAPTDGTANLTSVSALTDQRDNNTYAIAKLADGNCWMIENLRLESTAEHNSDGTLAQGYGTSATYGNFGGLANAENSGFTDTYTANSLYYSGIQEGNASINIGTKNYPAYRMPRYNNLNTSTRASNPTSNIFPDDNTTGGMYSYGNYYTWHAAIADLTYNSLNNQSVTRTSLCPAGWHLPKGGDKSNEANNELWSLVVDGINGGIKPANYGTSYITTPYYNGTPEGSDASNKLRAYPNNFLYSGFFVTSSLDRGSIGYYWSSTTLNNYYSYSLYLNSKVYPGTLTNGKIYGYSIRCTVGA